MSRATSVSRAGAAPRPETLGALLRLAFDVFRGRALAGLLPALEPFCMPPSLRSGSGIIPGEEGTGHGDKPAIAKNFARAD